MLQVKSGTIFDNILITDSVDFAEQYGKDTWEVTKDAEKKMKDAQDEEERKQREEEEKKRKDEEGELNMSPVARKPVFEVSDQVKHKHGCTSTEDNYIQ